MKRIEVALGIIVAGQNVLICRRREADPFAGLWEFPGGKRGQHETIEQCLARELAEELGITVRITGVFDTLEYDYPNLHVRLIPFLCAPESGEPRPLASQELRWVPVSTLRDWKFPQANSPLVEEIIGRLESGEREPRRRPPRRVNSDAKTDAKEE